MLRAFRWCINFVHVYDICICWCACATCLTARCDILHQELKYDAGRRQVYGANVTADTRVRWVGRCWPEKMMASFCFNWLLSLHHTVQSILAFGASGTHGVHASLHGLALLYQQRWLCHAEHITGIHEPACTCFLIPTHHLNKLPNLVILQIWKYDSQILSPLMSRVLCHRTHQKPLRCTSPSWLGGQ